ncbi:hypothetical protein ABBQ32_004312 [Trebouxia sp. C0010 RCD-2024]
MINLLGFSAAGPIAASWAAYTMSLYGGAVPAGWSRVPTQTSNRLQLTDLTWLHAGGLYATAQSMAMVGTSIGLGMPVAVVGGCYLAFKGTSFCVTRYRSNSAPSRLESPPINEKED